MRGLPRIKLPSFGRVYIPRPHMPRISAKVRFRFVNKGHRVVDYMARWEKTFLYRSGAAIRAWVSNSFKVVKDKERHSPIGKPPFLHESKAAFLKGAIQFAVNLIAKNVIVGVARSRAGFWGVKHDRGGYFGRIKGGKGKGYYPPRPFMKPAFRRWQKYGLPKILKDTGRKAYKL